LKHSNQATQPSSTGAPPRPSRNGTPAKRSTPRAREAPRQRQLVGGQHVDRVVRVQPEGRHAVGLLRKAPEHQRRLERHRVEAAGGHADQPAVGVEGGHHGHAGGELRERALELRRVEVGRERPAVLRLHRGFQEALRSIIGHARETLPATSASPRVRGAGRPPLVGSPDLASKEHQRGRARGAGRTGMRKAAASTPGGIDGIVERRIQEAQARGEFDRLPGEGRPLELDEDRLVPEEVRVAYRVLKNAGCVPPEVEALRARGAREAGAADEVDARADALPDAARRGRGARKLAALRLAIERAGARPSAALAQYRDRLIDRLGGESE
jgi:hypothetical protein